MVQVAVRPEVDALVEVRIAPEMHVLIQRAELRRPRPFELAVPVAADFSAHVAVEPQILRLGAGDQRVGSQFVDHRALLIDTVRAACRAGSPSGAGVLPSPAPAGSAGGPGGRPR